MIILIFGQIVIFEHLDIWSKCLLKSSCFSSSPLFDFYETFQHKSSSIIF